MATTNRVRAVPLQVEVEGREVFATPTGVKLSSRGRVLSAGELFGVLPKGEARRIRKALRRAGQAAKAGEIRLHHLNQRFHQQQMKGR